MPQESDPIQSDASESEDRLRNLSHDLRGSLHALETGIALLKLSRDDEEEFVELCRLIESEQRKTRDLVSELLALARAR